MTIFLQGNLEASCCLWTAWVIYSQATSLLNKKKPLKLEIERQGSVTEREESVIVPVAEAQQQREREKSNCTEGSRSSESLFPLQEAYLKVKPFQKTQRHNFPPPYFNTWSPNQFYEFSFSSSIQKILISKCTMTTVITVASYMENLMKE